MKSEPLIVSRQRASRTATRSTDCSLAPLVDELGAAPLERTGRKSHRLLHAQPAQQHCVGVRLQAPERLGAKGAQADVLQVLAAAGSFCMGAMHALGDERRFFAPAAEFDEDRAPRTLRELPVKALELAPRGAVLDRETLAAAAGTHLQPLLAGDKVAAPDLLGLRAR